MDQQLLPGMSLIKAFMSLMNDLHPGFFFTRLLGFGSPKAELVQGKIFHGLLGKTKRGTMGFTRRRPEQSPVCWKPSRDALRAGSGGGAKGTEFSVSPLPILMLQIPFEWRMEAPSSHSCCRGGFWRRD